MPLKAKSVKEFSVLISSTYGILVHNIEKKYVEKELAAAWLLSLFKASITSTFFWITQNKSTPMQSLLLLLCFSMDLNNLNVAVIFLLKGLTTLFACNYKSRAKWWFMHF